MIYKILAEYIQENIPGCSFVGIEESTGELFVSFTHTSDEKKAEDVKHLLEKFDEVKSIIIVERLDIKEATAMVESLNKFIAKRRDPDLIEIEGL